MTIFEFALLRAARQRMTPAELELAHQVADKADAGEPGYHEILLGMAYDALFDHTRPDLPTCCGDKSHEVLKPRLE